MRLSFRILSLAAWAAAATWGARGRAEQPAAPRVTQSGPWRSSVAERIRSGELADEGRFYTASGVKFHLATSRREFALLFAQGVPEADWQATAQAVAGGLKQSAITLHRKARLAQVRLDAPAGAAEWAALKERAAGHKHRARLMPVFVHARTGLSQIPTDAILVRPRHELPAEHLAGLEKQLGLKLERRVAGLGLLVFRIQDPAADPLQVCQAASALEMVEWAEVDFLAAVRFEAVPNDPQYPNQWHLNNTGQGGGTSGADVKAQAAWDITTGSPGIVIAIPDDAIETAHEDLSANIWVNPGEIAGNGVDDDANGYVDDVNGWDFDSDDNDPSPAAAGEDHGTAVAGVAAARGNNGIGVSGIARQCKILPIRTGSGGLLLTTWAELIMYAAKYGDVVSCSWSLSPFDEIRAAIQWAQSWGRNGKGTICLFASGNEAPAGNYVQCTLAGFTADSYTFRWTYDKNASISLGRDSAWLDEITFPGGAVERFSSGTMPAGWTTGGDASWSVLIDPVNAFGSSGVAKAGTITHSQSTWIEVTKSVGAGNLTYWGHTDSHSKDKLHIAVDGYTYSGLDLSGLDGTATDIEYPARYPESTAVGASNDLDYRSPYSQYGASLDVVAPSSGGVSGITTTDRTGADGYSGGNYTSSFGGTSSATPLASGIAALVLSVNSNLTASQVRYILRQTADKIGDVAYINGRNDFFGFGRVNALAAVQLAQSWSYTPSYYYVNDGSLTNDVYCTAVGSDANDGKTPSTPKATLQAVLDAYLVLAGDRIYCDTGTYVLGANIVITGADRGAAGAPIEIIGTTHAAGTTFDRNSGADGALVFHSDQTACVTVRNISFVNGSGGAYAYKSHDLTFENCVFYNNKLSGGGTLRGGVYLNESSQCAVRGCRILSNQQGLTVANSTSATLEGNLVSGTGAGVVISGASSSGLVRGNTVYVHGSVSGADALNVGSPNVTVQNNILWSDGSSASSNAIEVTVAGQSGFVSNYNLLRRTNVPASFAVWGGAAQSDLAAWRSASGQDANSLSADPLFVDLDGPDNVLGNADDDAHLRSIAGYWNGSGWSYSAQTSPCLDAGNPASAWGAEPLPNGGRVNIGAYGNTAQASKSPPTVASANPDHGSTAGGQTVTIAGTNLTGVSAATFGGSPAGNLTVLSDTALTCITPAHAAGQVEVTPWAPGGAGTGLPNGYTYVAPPSVSSITPGSGRMGGHKPPTYPSTATITGTGFVAGAGVKFDAAAAGNVVVESATRITCEAPAHEAGAADVIVTNPDLSSGSLADAYTYAGYENDVAPRAALGSEDLTAGDLTQQRRFVAGLDAAAPGPEFQRADVAPRNTLGDGSLTAGDMSQARRYVAGLDPPTGAGGPSQ
jgi:parallel beta-helix repeat protein